MRRTVARIALWLLVGGGSVGACAFPGYARADAPPIISFGPARLAHGYKLTGSVATDGTVFLTATWRRRHIAQELRMTALGHASTRSTVATSFHGYGRMRMSFHPKGKPTQRPHGCTIRRGTLSGVLIWRTHDRLLGLVSRRRLPAVQTLPNEYCRPQPSGTSKGEVDLYSLDYFNHGNSFDLGATRVGRHVSIDVDLGYHQYSEVAIDHEILVDGGPSLLTVSHGFRRAKISVKTPALTGTARFVGHFAPPPFPAPGPESFTGTLRGQFTARFAGFGTRKIIPHGHHAAELDHY
jgi:hypothetical protein